MLWPLGKQNNEPLSKYEGIKPERTMMHPKRRLISLDGVFAVRGEMKSAHEIASLLSCNQHLLTRQRFSHSGVDLDQRMIF